MTQRDPRLDDFFMTPGGKLVPRVFDSSEGSVTRLTPVELAEIKATLADALAVATAMTKEGRDA